jgi:glycerol-3-phosphate dehydrogenase
MNGGTDTILRSMPEYSRREITYLVQHEKVHHLDDFILRRTMLGMLGRVRQDRVDELAGIFANSLGWNQEEKQAEVSRMFSILAARHGVVFPKERQDNESESEGRL